jgi:Gly-Xaa carboxypeptidase
LELTDAWGTALEPAPVTPTDPDAEPYKLLSGTIVATYEASSSFKENNKPIVVTPGISTGNTGMLDIFW